MPVWYYVRPAWKIERKNETTVHVSSTLEKKKSGENRWLAAAYGEAENGTAKRDGIVTVDTTKHHANHEMSVVGLP